jgi:hypothetical protein
MFVNLTPHALHIYPPDTADRIEPGSVAVSKVISPSREYPPARVGHTVAGAGFLHEGVLVEDVAFGANIGQVTWLPDPVPGTWYVVSLPVGLAALHRDDLLVNHEYVRDLDGSIIGSRKLARPVRAQAAAAAGRDLIAAGATQR